MNIYSRDHTGTKVFRSTKSFNSQIGVAISVLMARGDEDFVIIEDGISKPDEMQRLQHIISPDITLITNLKSAHAEGFDSPSHKLSEKLALAKSSHTVI